MLFADNTKGHQHFREMSRGLDDRIPCQNSLSLLQFSSTFSYPNLKSRRKLKLVFKMEYEYIDT